jgi:O-antigen/teichoic acid export membrane protein
MLQVYVDAVVLSKLAPPVVVGWYGASKNFMNALITPAAIIGTAAYPTLSRVAGDPAVLRRQVRASMRPLVALAALAAVGTYLFSDLAVALVYGRDKYGPAATILRFFSVPLLLFFVDVQFGNVILATGRTRAFAVAKFAAVGVSAVLGVVLVPRFQASLGNGGVGVVVAFTVSELLMLVVALALVPRGTIDRGVVADLGRALLAGGGALLVVRGLPLSPVAALPACIVSYAALAAALGLVRREDLAVLATFRRRR